MNILITGAKGQLGLQIKKLSKKFIQHNFFFTDVAELDITSKSAINTYISKYNIQAIINCAAYTAVDKAEEDYDMAEKINATAVNNLAEAAQENNARLIHISTDYVFSGHHYLPYKEEDNVDPQSAYGRTKLSGENAILNTGGNAAIIRTAWLYSEHGNNFLNTMMRLGESKEELNIIFDQIGSPTYAQDLAEAAILLAEIDTDKPEIYHYTNEGVCSWYDFAVEIMNLNNIKCKIHPIETFQYPLPAARPQYSVLNKTKIKNRLKIEIPHWKESLIKCLSNFEK